MEGDLLAVRDQPPDADRRWRYGLALIARWLNGYACAERTPSL